MLFAWDLRRLFGEPDEKKEPPRPAPAPPVRAPEKPPQTSPARPVPTLPESVGGTTAPKGLTGDSLARRIYDRDAGRDSVAVVEMVLTSSSGKRRVRQFESQTLKQGGLLHSLIRFTYPQDIKDTSFLTLERQEEDAEQFLYLPALRRVRRIVAKQKGKSFVNSDLFYQDLERRSPDKDEHRILGEEVIENRRCWILESVPVDEKSSAYGKVVAWVDQQSLLPMKSESFDRKGRKIKSGRAQSIKQIDGIWTVMDSEVTTIKKRHTTRLTTREIRYNVGLDLSAFNKRALKK